MAESVQKQTRILRALGLCARARRMIFGVPMLCDAMQAGKAPLLVLEAADTSNNTHKRLGDKCAYYHVRSVRLELDAQDLAHAVGKTAALAAVGITDENMCRLIEGALFPDAQ